MGYIRVRNIGKAYKRYPSQWGRLAEWMGMGSHCQLKWALQDLTFDVAPGEAVGIIGFNGAGKSTLLKIIAGTTRQTTGDVEVGGGMAALLELGIGFHSDFTGRQNVYMAGQLRGLSTDQLDDRMREIEAFAEIGDYIDQPLRVYSSGMQVRLAFSVATVVRPEILIVDEALAVGDVLFQQKCFDRIRAFCEAGTTLLFVSHSLSAVYSLCDRALLINGGQLVLDGKPKEAIDLYNALILRARDASPASLIIAGSAGEAVPQLAATAITTTEFALNSRPTGSTLDQEHADAGSPLVPPGSFSKPGASIAAVQLLHEDRPVDAFVSESEMTIMVKARFETEYDDPHVGFQIRNSRGEAVFMTNTHCMGIRVGSVQPGEEVSVDFRFRAALAPGDYSITAGIANGGLLEGYFREPLSRAQDIRAFTVLRNPESILWAGVYNLAPICSVHRLTG